MMNILIAAPDRDRPADLEQALVDGGYRVGISVGCSETTRKVTEELGEYLTAVLLDSKLVASSVATQRRNGRGADIVAQLRGKIDPVAVLIVYMTRPFNDLPEDVARAVWRSDAIVDAPADPSEIVARLCTTLARQRWRPTSTA
jgi:hypothetical protein